MTAESVHSSDAEHRRRAAFDALLEVPEAERAAWLDAHVPDIADRAALVRLLAADARDGFLDTPAVEHAARLAADDLEPAGLIGRDIGEFRIVRALGQGGMAAVFLGERIGRDFVQRVAIKLLRRGLYSELEQRLFQRERRVLAALEHPNIARLIDGGVTAAGVPYLVMEYVDGVPITEFVQARRLGVRAIVELMLTVCRAVEAAHRNLIVHRDLKPSNILVGTDGSVKLLDFGIAKLIEEDADATGTLGVFTPDYAAPEQVRGGAITTATDVYGLGVLLHELLLGVRPDGSPTRRPSSRVNEVAGTDVPLPPARLRRLLRGDLDNILLQALAEEPERRYASAGALADDLERYLARRPIRAHPPSRLYRARKFVERHRGGVALTTVFVLGILAALGLALWQAEVARREAARANTVRDFLVGLFDAARAHLPRDQRPTPEALVEHAVRQLTGSRDLDTATRVDLLRTLGEVQLSLSGFQRAEDLFGQALDLARASGDAHAQAALRVLHADARQRAGQNAQAVAELAPHLDALRAAPSPDLVRALGVLAAAEMALGKPEDAVTHRREAAAAAQRVYGEDAAEALAAGFDVGNAQAQAQLYPQAIATLEPLLARWRASAAPEDDRYVAALSSLATANNGVGDRQASEALFRERLALERRIYTEPHDAIARTLRDLGLILAQSEKYAEAESLINEALQMLRRIYGDDHAQIAETYEALGNVKVSQWRYADAEANYRAAIATCSRTGIREEVCARAHNDLGMAFYRQQKYDQAKTEMTQALTERRAVFGDDHPTVAYSLSTLANVAAAQRDFPQAIRLSEQALDILERGGRGASREAALIRNGYAQALWLADRNADALREIDRTLADWQRVAPEGKVRRVMMLVQKAQILEDLKRHDDARRTADEAIRVGADPAELQATTKRLLRELSGRNDVYPEATAGTTP